MEDQANPGKRDTFSCTTLHVPAHGYWQYKLDDFGYYLEVDEGTVKTYETSESEDLSNLHNSEPMERSVWQPLTGKSTVGLYELD